MDKVKRGKNAVERIFSADEPTRAEIRRIQLNMRQQLNETLNSVPGQVTDDAYMTPYGPPSQNSYILPVPNDVVGLVIGKNGETIRRLQTESGAKIQVAKKEIESTNTRNVFVEGPPDKYQRAKQLIEDIIREHRRH